jgi:hypothetical protein
MPVTTERCPWCGSLISHEKFVQIQESMEKTIQTRLAKEVTAQQQKLLKERQALEADKARILKQIDVAKVEMEKLRRKEIAEIREILQKDRDAALAKQQASFAKERDAMEKKIAEMSRRVRKGGPEIADGAEIDLYDELKGAFPEDQITSTKRKAGGNILHDIRYKGKSAGKILIDARPRGAWQHAFVKKLRQDQTELGADHAILATPVFPAGKKELFVDSGVIVVAPARVPAIVDVLRRTLIAMHVAKLSEAERTDKLSRLYRFITSAPFKQKLAEASDLAGQALQIDVDEKKAHDLVWRKRGTVLTRIKNVLRDIDADVSAIVEARETPGPEPGSKILRPAAFQVKR